MIRPSLLFLTLVLAGAPAALAQQHDHHMMPMAESPLGIEHARDGSGTSWQPDESREPASMHHRGKWMLMAHGTAFLEYVQGSGPRGDDQFGSINWLMAMAQRPAAGGQLTFRGMVSAEPLTVGRCGYPNLLQSGESCRGEPLHDRQHPHDLFMEVAADYRRAIGGAVAIELYGGPAGEPALGPVAFPHRASAAANLMAPIGHHWLDSTHVSFGVATAAVYGRQWKLETSAFNGREPDDDRYGFDLAALDSYSGRATWLPSPQWAVQVSAGRLKDHATRITASATYHRFVGPGSDRLWATTAAWGMNRESHGATSALLVETTLDVTGRDQVYARGEITGKTPEDLVVASNGDDHDASAVSKVQMGYTRWLVTASGMSLGAGGSAGVAIVPDALEDAYGRRTSVEAAAYLTIRLR